WRCAAPLSHALARRCGTLPRLWARVHSIAALVLHFRAACSLLKRSFENASRYRNANVLRGADGPHWRQEERDLDDRACPPARPDRNFRRIAARRDLRFRPAADPDQVLA